jgi:hypothetical protein
MVILDLLKMWRPEEAWEANEKHTVWWCDAAEVVVDSMSTGRFQCAIAQPGALHIIAYGKSELEAVFAALQQHAYLAGAAYARKKDAAKAKVHAAIIHQRAERFRKR